VKIIVGLGNPGVHYQGSRHNVGFQVVDRLSERQRIPICSRRFKALYGTGRINSEDVVLVKPITFMNLSGEAVRKTANAFSVAREDLIVIHDDLDLALGRLRVKRKGGDGGHQGVRSIVEAMGSNAFLRLKVGIGRPPKEVDPADYVLSPFEEDDQPEIDSALSRAAEAVAAILSEGVEAALTRFHKKAPSLPSRSP
jgi:peptidyl-tRNA hydrolase, PTH1 family